MLTSELMKDERFFAVIWDEELKRYWIAISEDYRYIAGDVFTIYYTDNLAGEAFFKGRERINYADLAEFLCTKAGRGK